MAASTSSLPALRAGQVALRAGQVAANRPSSAASTRKITRLDTGTAVSATLCEPRILSTALTSTVTFPAVQP